MPLSCAGPSWVLHRRDRSCDSVHRLDVGPRSASTAHTGASSPRRPRAAGAGLAASLGAARRRRRRRPAACPGGTPGPARPASWRASRTRCGYAGSRAPSVRGCPGTSRTSPCGPGRNQNWLRYHPPGRTAPPARRGTPSRPSASTAQAWRSHRGGYDGPCAARRPAPLRRPAASARTAAGRAPSREPAVVDGRARRVADDLRIVLGAHRRPDQRATSAPPSGAPAPARTPSRGRRSPPSGRGTRRRAAPRPAASRGTRTARRPLRRSSSRSSVELADLGLGVGVVLAEAHPAAHVEQVPDGRAGVPAVGQLGHVARHDGRSRSRRPRSTRIAATHPTTDLVTDSTAWSGRGPPVGRSPRRPAHRPGARRRRRCRCRPGRRPRWPGAVDAVPRRRYVVVRAVGSGDRTVAAGTAGSGGLATCQNATG